MIDQRDLVGFTELQSVSDMGIGTPTGVTPVLDVLKCFIIYQDGQNITYMSPIGAKIVTDMGTTGDADAQIETYRQNFQGNKGLQFIEIPGPDGEAESGWFVSLRCLWYFFRISDVVRFVSISGASVDYDYSGGTADTRQMALRILNLLLSRGMFIDQATQK